MGLLRNFIENYKKKKEQFKELQEQDRMVEKVQELKMTPQERELLDLKEKERQENIKAELAFMRQKERDAYWKQNSLTQSKNVFSPQHKSVQHFNQSSSMLSRGNML